MSMLIRAALLLSGVILSVQLTNGQEQIVLQNPSFEDVPRAGGQGIQGDVGIKGWNDCGLSVFPGQTPPDIHPHPEAWKVNKRAFDGKTFLGLVVRADDTWELLSQGLSSPLEGGRCYQFSVFLSKSQEYMGLRNTDENPGQGVKISYSRPFLTPAVLRIWGGSSVCRKNELLAESEPVANLAWEEYIFKFEPAATHRYIIFEAFYKTPTLVPYNGHILVDKASAIEPVPCDRDLAELIDEREEPQPTEEAPVAHDPPRRVQNPAPRKEPPQPESVGEQKVQPPPDMRILSELERGTLRKGQTIRIDKLYFKADSSRINEDSHEVLGELYRFLKYNDDVIVEIGGHTNTKPSQAFCDSLSTARARAVTNYLIEKGVPTAQLKYKGYGKRHPIIPNDWYNREYQKKNQRVEIKILSLDG